MKTVSFVSVAAILTLGACSHYSEDLASLEGKIGQAPAPIAVMAMEADPQNIAPAAGGPVSMETLNAALAREYYEMARYENDTAFDYKAAKLYTTKAKMAAEGKLVVPSKVSAFDVPRESAGDLNAAREELISALKTQNTAENQTALAIAQARYECWLERADEAADETHYASCKDEFEQAMAQIVAPAAGVATPTAYDVGFAANSAVLDEASKNTVAYLANFMMSPENAAYSANLTGFTMAAQGEFAQKLTNNRVIAVRDALVERGVDAARLNPLISAGAPGAGDAALSTGKVQVLLNAPVISATTTEFVATPPREVPVDAGN